MVNITTFLGVAFFLFGLIVGSFINALEYRLAQGVSIIGTRKHPARSYCPHCRHTLAVHDLVPVVSYILLRGRCRYCQKQIHWQYPVVELATGLVSAAAALRYGWSLDACVVALFGMILVFVFLYDHKHQLILDQVMVPAILLAIPLSLARGVPVVDMLFGVLIGGGFFLLQYLVSRGRWIGGGDIRLGVLMGILLGVQSTVAALFLAYVVGAAVALVALTRRQLKLKSQLAFGTFLSVATYICLLFGPEMVEWYVKYFLF